MRYLAVTLSLLLAFLLAACKGSEAQPVATATPILTATAPSTPTAAATPGQQDAVTLRWYGHAMFLLTSPSGTTILMDPYGDIGYPKPQFAVPIDAVTISHNHPDHDNATIAGEDARVIRGIDGDDWVAVDEMIGDVRVRTFLAYHDDEKGLQRGQNSMFLFEVNGLRILHTGDLGHLLSQQQVNDIGRVDVLLIPVGGYFTIGAAEATQVVAQINPRIVVPMHYRTPDTRFAGSSNLATAESFLAGKPVTHLDSTTLTIDPTALPQTTTIIVMSYR